MGIHLLCKFLSKPSRVRRLLSTWSQPTRSRMSKPKFRIRRASHQISRDSSSLVNNLRTEEPFPTTTSRRSRPSIWFSDSEAEVWVPSRLSQLLLLSPESSSARNDLQKVLCSSSTKGRQLQ